MLSFPNSVWERTCLRNSVSLSWQQNCRDNSIPKQSLGTREAARIPNGLMSGRLHFDVAPDNDEVALGILETRDARQPAPTFETGLRE